MAIGDMMRRVMGRMRFNPQQAPLPGAAGGQGSMGGFGSEAGPTGVGDWMQQIPEVQARQRRVEQLRAQQQQGQERAATPASGMMLPTQHGGLYETVARYRPDYAGLVNQGMGALQSHFGGKQAEMEAQGLDTARTNMLMRGAQQASGGFSGLPMQQPGAANRGMMNYGASALRRFQP